jgi:DNA polymerase-3 subunit delta'
MKPRNAQAALRELADQQTARAKRLQRDALDRVLTELTSFYRDVLTLQTGAGVELINAEQVDAISTVAGTSSAEGTVSRLDAILAARTALETNVAPLLAMESLLISLADSR